MTAPALQKPPPAPHLDAPKPPLLERLGVRYFERRSVGRLQRASADAIHELNRSELTQMRGVQRGAVMRSALAGALSTLVAGLVEHLATPLLGVDPAQASWSQTLTFWSIVGAAMVLTASLEIAFLYWDSLRSVHELARGAGLELFPGGEGAEASAVAGALARAALELPNPAHPVFGIRPHREASKWKLLLASLAYKAKVGATTFLAKLVLRRLLGRVAVRSALPFVAVPITAGWNALVTFWVLREARIRAMGPSAVQELLGRIFGAWPLSPAGRVAALRAVGAAIVRTQDMHPNVFYLLSEVRRRVGGDLDEELDDPQLFVQSLPTLSESERHLALNLLSVALIIDGRLSSREQRLLAHAFQASGRAAPLEQAKRLRRAFVRGLPLPSDALL